MSSEPLNRRMQPNVVWWCIIMTQSVMRKVWVPIFIVCVVSECLRMTASDRALNRVSQYSVPDKFHIIIIIIII